MSSPRPLANYPKAYFDLFRALASHPERLLSGLTNVKAQRKDLYNFRASLGLAGMRGDRDAATLNLLSQNFTFKIASPTSILCINRTLTDPFHKRVSGMNHETGIYEDKEAQPYSEGDPSRDV